MASAVRHYFIDVLVKTCATLIVLGWTLNWACEVRSADKPNIVLIFVDDLGYGDVGCYGAVKVQTPNIDRLASEGCRFTDAHSASAVCTPSRYALLTGEYPFRPDIWGPVMNPSPLVVPLDKTTIASMLKKQGYATACFGKWHLGFGSTARPDWNAELKPGPLELGFDHFFGIPVVSSHPPFVWVEDHRVLGLDPSDPLKYGGVPPTQKYPEKMFVPAISGGRAAHALYRDEDLGTDLTEKALTWMGQQANSPFFLYFSTPHIHHPFTPHRRFQGTSQAGRYGDFIHELDWMVGELLKSLDEHHLTEKTLVILTSDNGGMLNQGGQEAWKLGHRINGDLLGFKFDAWEGGHRVPFLVRWPNVVPPGSVSRNLICHVDLYATFADVTGAKLGSNDALDSLSQRAILEAPNQPAVRDELVISPNKKTHLAIRKNQWLYIGARGGGGFGATQPGDHALGGPAALQFTGELNSDVEHGRFREAAPQEQLYDLNGDLRQMSNVLEQSPDVAAMLRARLEQIRSESRTRPNP